MKLHENKDLFNQAIRATAQRMDILDIYIEKDYWVCYALKLIYSSAQKNDVIFKGGTALSKCFDIIERFSEDIDLVLLRTGDETGNQLKSKLKKVTKVLTNPFIEVDMEGVTNKMGMIRKVAYNYPKAFEGNFGQVRDHIIVEASWLGHFEPYSTKQIASYIFEMMVATKQEKLAEEYEMAHFDVIVLDVRRTLCEKIMSIVRFSHTNDPITDLNNKIRHLYDIHKLLSIEEVKAFFLSNEFETMLLKVAKDDVFSFKSDNKWLELHPTEALIFKDPDTVWKQLRSTYLNNFKNLVYGELPDEDVILKSIKEIASRLIGIE
ncbi:nucleotidyl transferase AbiEii/AbiGii toxin family protein [Flavivirga jejuensis]|uniref:Nucleotidyl transferase AbiEii/AbiGii toxin family protein n=1 Tax=Flavivirga jejuensis TaxID=870487 RepID=A0ABT8WSW4_9FLAO|nr:nucleotidyl transferase AbiEii/AbiGii toxin family protein [Flavivirga jejuensis]MDO5976251.1 nucleotidyl transferase AbiEii/AbiGii toxin family protein [Flavivirga jejuensis]